jgi:hypothetical protein
MNKAKAPKAPDPQDTIEAQTKANTEALQGSKLATETNQIGPTGSLKYTTDSSGRSTATTALSPGEQSVYDPNVAFRAKAAGTGLAQLGNAAPMLEKPIDLSDPNIGTEITSKLEPEFLRSQGIARQRRATELANKGIFEGSEAWVNAMRDFDANYTDSWNRLSTNARGQVVNEMLTSRNQPISEIAALEGLAPVNYPGQQFVNTPGFNLNPTNVSDITQQGYENKLAAAQMKQQQQNAMMGGLFGLGSAALMAGTGGLGGFALPALAAGGLMAPKSSVFPV